MYNQDRKSKWWDTTDWSKDAKDGLPIMIAFLFGILFLGFVVFLKIFFGLYTPDMRQL